MQRPKKFIFDAYTISVYFINKVNAILDRRNNTKSDWDVINSVRVYEVPFRTWY